MHQMVSYCTAGHCLATESCPLESVEERAYLDYVREDYGPSIKADDDQYLISSLEKLTEISETNPIGGCPAHNGLPPVDPENPEGPVDPNDPNGGTTPPAPGTPEPSEPSSGGESHEGYGPSPKPTPAPNPTPAPEPNPTPEPNPSPEPEPSTPGEPEEPSAGGGLFEDLWN